MRFGYASAPVEPIEITRGPDVSGVALGLAWGSGCRVAPAPAGLSRAIERAVAEAPARHVEALRKAVRDLLRHGRYKPTGRGKPASEYLLNAAREGRFPRINNLVDVNNLVSLESLLPISVVDVARAGTRRFVLRRGREGESYVFNSAGQAIDLQDLLLVAAIPDDRPCANPVKDSMATKVADDTRDVAVFVYAPASLAGAAREAAERFADYLRRWADAAEAGATLSS